MEVNLVPLHSVEMISASVLIKVGARDETWQTWGSAHFLEHLLFNGTENRTQEDIYHAFDNIGAYHNAHTGSHFTNFMLLVNSEHFATGFDILTDMLFNSNLPDEKFEKERGIVIEEIKQTQTRSKDSDRLFRERLFGDHPMARDVLGTQESIARLKKDDVWKFYKDWYVPNNMSLYLTGHFNPDTMQVWLNEHLEQFRPSDLPSRTELLRPNYPLLSQSIPTVFTKNVDKPLLSVAFDAPSVNSEEFIAFLGLYILLEKHLQEKGGDDFSFGVGLAIDPDLSVLKLTFSGDNSEALWTKGKSIIKDLVNKPVSADEIRSIALKWQADEVFNSERLHFYSIMYSQWWAVCGYPEFANWSNRLAKLTPQDIQNVASKWLNTEHRFVMLQKPIVHGETAAVQTSERNVSVRILDNGLTLIVNQDPTARVFAMHVLVKDRWKWDQATYGAGSADVLHRLFTAENPKDKVKFAKRLNNIAANVKTNDDPYIPFDDYYTTPDFSFIRYESLPEYWFEGLGLVMSRIKAVPLNQTALDNAIEQTKRSKGRGEQSPMQIGRKALLEAVTPDEKNNASVYGDVSLTLKELESFQRDYFHPSNLIISVSSPISDEEVAVQVQQHLSGLPASSKNLALSDKQDALIPSLVSDSTATIELGKPQGALLLGSVVPDIDNTDRAALFIANAWLNDKLAMVLREERGLAYSLGSSIQFKYGENGSYWGYWELSIGTQAINIDKAKEGMFEILATMSETEFSDSEISRLKNAVSGRMMMREMSQIGQAYSLGTGYFYWNNPSYRREFTEQMMSVSADDVKRAVAKYLIDKQFISVEVR